jgi:cold shock CspA family protein
MSDVFLRGTVARCQRFARGEFPKKWGQFPTPRYGGGPGVFVHWRGLAGFRDLQEGARVRFLARDSSHKPGTNEAHDVSEPAP